jgi:hypothetical protein
MVYRMDAGFHWIWNAGWHERCDLLLCRDLISLVSYAIMFFFNSDLHTQGHYRSDSGYERASFWNAGIERPGMGFAYKLCIT